MLQTLGIRYVEERDYLSIVGLAREVVNLVLPEEDFDEGYIRTTFLKALENKECTGIVLEIDGIVQGYVLGIITPNYFHPKTIALCTSIYIRPLYRRHGIQMLRAFESWAKYRQAQTLSVSVYQGLSPEGLDKVYLRLGYTMKEINYQKEI